MNKSTPGPWIVHQRPSVPLEYGQYVTTHDGLTVCNVSYQLPAFIDGQVVEEERIANALLIAAAPELLAALHNMLEDGDKTDRAQAIAAIKKATGEQP